MVEKLVVFVLYGAVLLETTTVGGTLVTMGALDAAVVATAVVVAAVVVVAVSAVDATVAATAADVVVAVVVAGVEDCDTRTCGDGGVEATFRRGTDRELLAGCGGWWWMFAANSCSRASHTFTARGSLLS